MPRKNRTFQTHRTTLETRYAILQAIREGNDQKVVAKSFGLARQTVARIVKEEWAKYQEPDKTNWLNFSIKRKA